MEFLKNGATKAYAVLTKVVYAPEGPATDSQPKVQVSWR